MQSSALPDEHLRVARSLERLAVWARHARSAALSASGISVLSRLHDDGAARITRLAVKEDLTQPGMTSLINRLESEGLAVRTADPEDGRAVLVEITSAGRSWIERHRAERLALIADRIGSLAPGDRAALIAALPALQHLTIPTPRKNPS